MKTQYSIGLMSGTSLDGVDLVYTKISFDTQYNFKIIHSETIPYPKYWEEELKKAFYYSKDKLSDLDKSYGIYLAELINTFIIKNNIKTIDFIASHGHTIHHKPEEGYTLQIGNGQIIASKTGVKTICDFRSQDVALGGQGAPLVPIGDKLLFPTYTYCLNLGGFANISFDNAKNERIAFDICPTNIVLNHYTEQLGFAYDDKGEMAQSGTVNKALLDELNELPFYKVEKPKSLGFEYVEETILPLINTFKLAINDILATYVAHIAVQIGSKLTKQGNVLVTGGGTFNTYLMKNIQAQTALTIEVPNKIIIDYKEALIFAFLGFLRNENQVNCLKTVTGATKDHSSGMVFYPKN